MANLPVTIPGWELLGYRFDDVSPRPEDGQDPAEYSYRVARPDGADLGTAVGEIPEAAAAAACDLARADHLS